MKTVLILTFFLTSYNLIFILKLEVFGNFIFLDRSII